MRVARPWRRWVVVVVVALLAVSGASTASAWEPGDVLPPIETDPDWPRFEAWRNQQLGELTRAANPPDYHPRDMKVAAPSSVIGATVGSESPTRQVQEVNRWRPNPQAWIDAKTRAAGTSGLTTADIEKTGRWKPTVAGLRATTAWGCLLGGCSEVAWMLRDGAIYPLLELANGWDAGSISENQRELYCVRDGNFATDLLGRVLTGTECGDWRLALDYQALVGSSEAWVVSGTVGGHYYVGTEYGAAMYCYGGEPSLPPGASFWQLQSNGSWAGTRPYKWDSTQNPCVPAFGVVWYAYASPGTTPIFGVRLSGETEPSTSMTGWIEPDHAEWITRVRCLDGSIRTAVSDSFQQEALGGVAVPESVALDGCQPVGLDVGLQKAGTGTAGAMGTWPTGNHETRSQVGTAEVPIEVQDWMRDFPDCWDGSCILELKKVIDDIEIDCFISPEECVDWYMQVQTQPQTYRCYYGGQLVSIEECNVYSRVFDRQKVQEGTGYGNPKTGAAPTPNPSTGTTTTTNPGAARVAMEVPVANPSTSRECWPSGWGVLNPFEWVYMPVRCVLEWAFVPRPEKLTQVQTRLQLAAVNSKPGELVTVVNEWQSIGDQSVAGCSGPHVAFSVLGAEYSGYPLSACEAPASTFALVSRIALTIVFALGALIAITRYVGGVFGYRGVGDSA